jgi:hypothetical protein
MPTWDKILQEVDRLNPIAVMDGYVQKLHAHTNRTVICYMTAFTVLKPAVPSTFHSIIDQDMQGFMTCVKNTGKDALDLILHTPGGDLEATIKIINYLQHIYPDIRVFIPHLAMSGGTLIACSADEIVMGPYSSLGPTDPQVYLGGSFVPVDSIIKEFERAFDEVKQDLTRALLWNERLKQIPFGKLNAIELLRQNSLVFLKTLLKSRNCSQADPAKIDEIADFMNSNERHSSHAKGISLKQAQDIGLRVTDLSLDKDLEDLVLSIYHSAIIAFERTALQKIISNHLQAHYIIQYSK